MTAIDQLRRLLAILPQIGGGEAVPIADVARRAGSDPDTILADLRDLSDREGDPAGFVEHLQLFIESERISMAPTLFFQRPTRLNEDEWRAIELGIALLRAERKPDDRPALDALLAKVRQLMAEVPAQESQRAATLGAERHADVVAVLRRAMRTQRKVEITYQKGTSDAPDVRSICPFSFVTEQGAWYLVAHCERSEAIRVFRLDRLLAIKVLAEPFEESQDIDVEELMSKGHAFVGDPPERLRVRYSARIAKWIAERERGTSNADGSFEVEYPLGDADWAIRHVLQYGPDAEVLAPARIRDALVARLKQMSA
ncbi:MAG TPA: WYL domain-containing protein [Gemmatimonadaceae bacterium]|nr:WYL domain-containing protein [Gemmatimonadaceae bacterium]